MSAYEFCRSGNCDPFSCPVCGQACEMCDELDCICPTLPIDTEDQP